MGFGQSDEQAVLVAIAELVERACLLATWGNIASSLEFGANLF
jgi:hypothetical protein